MGRSFLRGAAWLAVGSLASKLLGAVYRVFLPRVLGEAGVGLFQMAYPLYAVVLTLAVTGIPLALSKLTAEWRTVGRDRDADHLADWALVGLGLLGLGLAAGMALASRWLARAIFHEPRAALPMLALSPALALVALEAGWRGYFQGRQRMRPTAISQILEQGVRVLVMFPLAMALLSRGLSAAVAGAVAGAPVGAAVGVWYLARARRQHGPLWPRLPVPWRGLGRLAVLAAPMAMTALLFPVLLLTDAVVVPGRLVSIGYSATGATAAYGRLAGEAMPLVNLTLILGTALGLSVVPSVAAGIAAGDRRRAVERVGAALGAIWLVGVPLAGGLFVLARPLTTLLYGNPGAALALAILCLAAVALTAQQLLANALQAAGHGWVPVANLLAALVVKAGLDWGLVPRDGIEGAAAATVAAALLAVGLNWRAWCRRVGRPVPLARAWVVPVTGTLVVVAAVRVYLTPANDLAQGLTVLGPAAPTVSTLLAILLGMLVYAAVVLPLGGRRFWRRLWQERP